MPLILDPKLDIENASERLLCHLTERCQLPSVAHEILAIDASASDRDDRIRESLQHDAALVIRILRHLNSDSYCIDTKVSEIKTAVEVLGFSEIRNLSFVIILGRLFSDQTAHGLYTRYGLWTHCVSVGSAARLISRVCGVGQPSEMFFAGLLHDLGILFLDLQLNRSYHSFVSSVSTDSSNDVQERRRFGVDHAKLGMAVLKRWNLPKLITDCVRYHHQALEYSGEFQQEVGLIAVANYLASRLGWSATGVHNVATPAEEIYQSIGLDSISLAIICDEIPEVMQRASLLAQ